MNFLLYLNEQAIFANAHFYCMNVDTFLEHQFVKQNRKAILVSFAILSHVDGI